MPALLARGGVTGAAADRALRRQHDRQPPSPPGGRSLPARRDSAPGNYGAHFERGLCWLLPGSGSIGGRSAADRLVADRAESTFATSGTRKSALP